MKYKAVTGMIGASVVLASLSGCGAKKSIQETETELQTLLIENVEVVAESEMEILLETELTTETGTEQAPADLALDLSGENEDEAGPAEDDQLILEETDPAEQESGKANAGKPGEPETQPEKADPSGSEKAGDETPADEKQTEEEKTEKGQGRPDSRETDTEDDTESVSTENESDEASAIQAAADSPADTDADTEKEPAEAAKVQTGSGTKAESADAPEAEAQTESEEEDKSADVSGTAGQTESEAEDESADAIRTERQSESDTEMTETFETGVTAGEEIEAETVPEAETDLETGAVQDAETDPGIEAEQDTETDSEAEQDSENAAEVNRETGAETDAETDSEAGAETDADTDSETGALQDQETDSGTESESETDSDDETESETELSEEETGIRLVKGDRVNVRETPSTEAEIMASLTKGMDVYALDEEDDWTHICYENMADIAEGFVKSEYLGKLEEFYKANTRVNVRMEASTEADKAGALSEGDIVFVLEQESSGWSRIQFTDEDGETIEAYVKTEFLEQIDPESIDSVFREKVESLYGLNGSGETAAGNGMAAGNGQAGAVTDAGDGQTSSDEESAPQSGAGTEETEDQGTKTSKKSGKDAQSSLPEDAKDAQRQLALFRQLYPDAGKVGVIYSSDNTDAAAQLTEYESFAGQYGIELVSAEIKDEIDIDMAASEMAGAVDGILYMEDPLVAGLVQTVCAYANEVGIPVIGLEQSQTDQGCVAAYEGGKLFWNADGAAALGLSPENPEE